MLGNSCANSQEGPLRTSGGSRLQQGKSEHSQEANGLVISAKKTLVSVQAHRERRGQGDQGMDLAIFNLPTSSYYSIMECIQTLTSTGASTSRKDPDEAAHLVCGILQPNISIMMIQIAPQDIMT